MDAAFSNAVFHWIKDHDALFARLHAALRPGAPLVAQCGGKGNIDGFRRLADEVAAEQPFAEHMASFEGPWNYAAPAETEERLRARRLRRRRAAGSSPGPSNPAEPLEYASTVCLGNHLAGAPRAAAARRSREEVVRRSGQAVAPRLRAPEHHRPRIDVPHVFGYCSVCGRGIVDRPVGVGACPEQGLLVVAAVSALAIAASLPAAAGAWAPAATATVHPGVQTFTAGAPVHRELHLHRLRRHLHRAGRALQQHR